MIDKIQSGITFGKLKIPRSISAPELKEYVKRTGNKRAVAEGLCLINRRSGKNNVKFIRTPYTCAMGCYEFQILDKDNLPLSTRETFSINDTPEKTTKTLEKMCTSMENHLIGSQAKGFDSHWYEPIENILKLYM